MHLKTYLLTIHGSPWQTVIQSLARIGTIIQMYQNLFRSANITTQPKHYFLPKNIGVLGWFCLSLFN